MLRDHRRRVIDHFSHDRFIRILVRESQADVETKFSLGASVDFDIKLRFLFQQNYTRLLQGLTAKPLQICIYTGVA